MGDFKITETFRRNSSKAVRNPIAPEPTTRARDADMFVWAGGG